jgi:hypothetical protein
MAAREWLDTDNTASSQVMVTKEPELTVVRPHIHNSWLFRELLFEPVALTIYPLQGCQSKGFIVVVFAPKDLGTTGRFGSDGNVSDQYQILFDQERDFFPKGDAFHQENQLEVKPE